MTTHPGPAVGDGVRPAVVRAGETDVDVLSQVIAYAFHDLAISRWLIPDLSARRGIFPLYFRLFVEYAIATGTVYTTPERTAVALWVPVGEEGPRPPDDYGPRLAAATGRWLSRFEAFDATLDRHHPAGFPHHHLAMLAVRPDRQQQGTGTVLLRAHHAALGRSGLPAYLEASSPDTRRIYLRHGYLDYGAVIQLPDGGPRMYPMMRHPQAADRRGNVRKDTAPAIPPPPGGR
jgi:GNAT superfamily N-acetyltransferase